MLETLVIYGLVNTIIMAWTNTQIENLILIGKDIGVHLTESICNKLDLGRSIDIDVDMLYLVSNIVFSLEHSSVLTHTDDDYKYLAEMLNRIEIQRNRYRGL